MTARRLVLPLGALAWVLVATLVAGPPRLVAWCGAIAVASLALADVVWLLRHRRVRVSASALVFIAGAVLLVAGCVSQLTSYRV